MMYHHSCYAFVASCTLPSLSFLIINYGLTSFTLPAFANSPPLNSKLDIASLLRQQRCDIKHFSQRQQHFLNWHPADSSYDVCGSDEV